MATRQDFPIHIRKEDYSISLRGDLLVTGPAAEKVRRLLLNHPSFYARFIVPFIRQHEASFKPNELWIDPQHRIHITNQKAVQRMRRHIAPTARRKQTVTKE